MIYPIGTGLALTLLLAATALPAHAADQPAEQSVTMHTATQDGESVGTITIATSPDGAAFQLDLHGLPPGRTASTSMKTAIAARLC